jgi:alcohol dehydrogenase (cytochrome c)
VIRSFYRNRSVYFYILVLFCAGCQPPESIHKRPNVDNGQKENGIYTERQADRGLVIYNNECARCHGTLLDDGTVSPLTGPYFLSEWAGEGRTLDVFFNRMKSVMTPKGVVLPDQEWVEVFAYILRRNGYPAGDKRLTSDSEALGSVSITNQGAEESENDRPPVFVRGEYGIIPHSASPMQWELEEAGEQSTEWLSKNHDYTGRRQGNATQINRTNTDQLQLVNQFEINLDNNMVSGPVIYEGVMYVTSANATAAFEAVSGNQIWRYDWAPKVLTTQRENQGVAIKSGRVIRTTTDGYLIAHRMGNGSLLWARQIADPTIGEVIRMVPLINKSLILVGGPNWLAAFKIKNGEAVWRYDHESGWNDINDFGEMSGSSLTLDVDTNTLFAIIAHDLLALKVNTGALVWSEPVGSDLSRSYLGPLFQTQINETPYKLVGSVNKDGWLHVLDRPTHHEIYRVNLIPKGLDGQVSVQGYELGGSPAYNEATGMLYIPAARRMDGEQGPSRNDNLVSGTLIAVETATGEINWQHHSIIPLSTVVTTTAGAIVFTGNSTGHFLVLDGRTGQVLFQYNTNNPVGESVTYVIDGKQYIATLSGKGGENQGSGKPASAYIFALPD